MVLYFKLVKPARSKGGDRYESGVKGNDDHMVVYFPQSISRLGTGTPRPEIKVTIE